MTYLKVDNKFVYLPGGQMLGIPPPPPPAVLRFNTDNYENNFQCYVGAKSGVLTWDFGDGIVLSTNSPNYKYDIPGMKTISVYDGTTIGKDAITEFSTTSNRSRIIGPLDLTGLNYLTRLQLSSNTITNIIFPNDPSIDKFTAYYLSFAMDIIDMSDFNVNHLLFTTSGSDTSQIKLPINSTQLGNFNLNNLPNINKVGYEDTSVGTIDISNISHIYGVFSLSILPATITDLKFRYSVSNPTPLTNLVVSNTKIINLDFTNFNNISVSLNIHFNNNTDLKTIKFGNSISPINATSFYITYNNSLETIDISGLTNITSPNFDIYNNPKLNNISFPTLPGPGSLNVYNNASLNTLDISGFEGGFDSTKDLLIYNCNNLENIIFPSIDTEVVNLTMYGNNLSGTLDLSHVNVKNYINLGVNNNLQNMIFRKDSSAQRLTVSSNNYNDTIDLSNLTFIKNIHFSGGTKSAKNIIFPTLKHTDPMENLYFYKTDCSVLDFSWLNNIGWKETINVNINNNIDLEEIILPTVPFTVGGIYIGNSKKIQEADLYGLPGLSTVLSIYGENFNNLILPTSLYNEFTTITLINSKYNQTTIDNILSLLNDRYSLTPPTKNLTVSLQGGTNAVPTGGASNSDILSLIDIFDQAGKTLTLTYNT